MPAARSSAAGRAALLYPRSDSLAAPRWGRICIARAQLTNGNADRVVGVSMQMKEAWPWGPHARGVRAAPVGGRCSPERGPRERGEGRGGDGTNAVICFFPFFIFFFSGAKNIIRKFFSGMRCFKLRFSAQGPLCLLGKKNGDNL